MLTVSSIYIKYQLIYNFAKPKWDELLKLEREISNFQSGVESSSYKIKIQSDLIKKLVNFVPLPTHRTRRSHIHKIKKSAIVKPVVENLDKMNSNEKSKLKNHSLNERLSKIKNSIKK